MNKTENDDNEETWARLTEMASFPFGCCGFFKTRLGMCTYNRDHRKTILRNYAAEKDSMWGAAPGAPIGKRIAHASSSLTWGALNTDNHGATFRPYVIAFRVLPKHMRRLYPMGRNMKVGVKHLMRSMHLFGLLNIIRSCFACSRPVA